MIDANAISIAAKTITSDSQLQQRTIWVATTGKPELFVRDHIGAALTEHHPDLVIAREWNKYDLAVLNGGLDPIMLIEGKHLYDFDLLSRSIRARYHRSIHDDIKKLRMYPYSTQLVSLLMTSFTTKIPSELALVTKYSKGINKWLKRHGSELMPKALEESRLFLGDFGNIVSENHLAQGNMMGLDVHLWMWVVQVN